jgi:hypothetical protein
MAWKFTLLPILNSCQILHPERFWFILVVRFGQGTLFNLVPCSFIDPLTASIIPCLALRGIAGGIASSPTLLKKVLLRELSCIRTIAI